MRRKEHTMGNPGPSWRNAPPDSASAVEENVQAIKRWEKTILLARSKAEQVIGGQRLSARRAHVGHGARSSMTTFSD